MIIEKPAEVETAIRSLFIKHGIAKEPDAAAMLRARRAREINRINRAGRRKGEVDSAYRARIHSSITFYDLMIRRVLFDIKRYSNWKPTPENWIQLSLALAASHKEAGFEFKKSAADNKHENTFYQDTLIEGFLMPRGRDGDEAPIARNAAAAARFAAKHIDAGLMSGGSLVPSDGSEPRIRSVTPESLASGYSTRKKARERREVETGEIAIPKLPPSLQPWIDGNAEARIRFSRALNLTRWPEERFYSADEISRVTARASEEHLRGPLKS